MRDMGLPELRVRLEEVLEDISYEEDSLRVIRADITRIVSDLAEAPDVLVEMHRKANHDYPGWRRRAKDALRIKRIQAHELKNRLRDLKSEQYRLEQLISARESEYDGDDPMLLLAALTRIIGQVCRESGYRLTPSQEKSLNAARAALGLLDLPFA